MSNSSKYGYTQYLKNQKKDKPIKYLATNFMNCMLYLINDNDIVQDFLINKVDLYTKVKGGALCDLIIYQGLLYAEGKNQKIQFIFFTNLLS